MFGCLFFCLRLQDKIIQILLQRYIFLSTLQNKSIEILIFIKKQRDLCDTKAETHGKLGFTKGIFMNKYDWWTKIRFL